MAILKSVLEESLLSKSEQAALRVLARVSTLNEGLVVLQKLQSQSLNDAGVKPSAPMLAKVSEFNKYLTYAIETSLLQHRLPVYVPTAETKSQ